MTEAIAADQSPEDVARQASGSLDMFLDQGQSVERQRRLVELELEKEAEEEGDE